MMGNLPYLVPVVSFVVFAYFLAYASVSPGAFIERLRALQWQRPAATAIAGGLLSLAAAYRCFTIGTDQLVSYNSDRYRDGTSSLHTFLTYGGATDLGKWIDTALNVSPWIDMTLYAGILLVPLLCLAIIGMTRRQRHFAITSLVVLLFTLATPLAMALFYLWPGMKYFRHLGLVSPLVRVLLCFVAGIGFDWLIHQRGRRLAVAGTVLSAILIAMGLYAFTLSLDHAQTTRLVDAISTSAVGRPEHMQFADVVARRLWHTTLTAGVAAILVGFGAIALSTPWLASKPRASMAWVSLVLLFAGTEVYAFKFEYLVDRSEIVPESDRFVTRPAAMEFPARREVSLKSLAVGRTSPRLAATIDFSSMFAMRLQGRASTGAQYWSNNMFVFVDEAGSTFQVDSWLKPFDELIRMYWHWPIHESTGFPPDVDLNDFHFPMDHPATGRVTGVTAGKIRFFSHAYAVESLDSFPPLMTDPGYAGNTLLVVEPQDAERSSARLRPWKPADSLSADDAQPLMARVERFDANTLRIAVDNPGAPSWMTYADIWHPSWRASVNGKTVPIYRANLAYKAVPLESGANVVEFRFGSREFSVLAALMAANAAFWIAATAWLAIRS